ncbi:MAG: HAMP domain-containing histidine kinase [Hyphomicrobiales bacterium]|nr:HAMP domain-containing histidine kinase [Hyphomicrobiales bacterium]
MLYNVVITVCPRTLVERQKMFRLFSYFSLSSAIAIVFLTTILVGAYQHHATSVLVATAEKQNVAMASALANTIWPEFSSYLTTQTETDGDQIRSHPETSRLHNAFKTITAGLPVHKVKFYNLGGVTVYSSEFSQIGDNKSDNDGFIEAAVRGLPASKISNRDKFSAFSSTLHDIDVVESYVPIKNSSGSTVGVLELYYEVTTSVAEINDNRWMIAKVLVAAFGVLYIVLLLLVRRAEVILRSQYDQLQSELLKKERLSILGQLTATVGHELRNPLSAMRNALYIIRNLSKGSAEMTPFIEAGERSIGRCDNIVQDLLEHNRQYKLDCQSLDLSKWVRPIIDEQSIPQGITLTCDLEEPGPIVSIDDDRFRLVVVNLIENAVQALRSASRPGTITVTIRADGELSKLVIADNGSGIAPDVLPNIFEPLFTTKSFGTGLGLPTAKRLVEQHGGQLTVSSTRDTGTKFTILIPSEKQHQRKVA